MLVLSRKRNESITINDDVVITVLRVQGETVRLGIEAPMDVPVHRREVHDAMQRKEVVLRTAEVKGGICSGFSPVLGSGECDAGRCLDGSLI